MPLYPTENILWDENQIPNVHYTGYFLSPLLPSLYPLQTLSLLILISVCLKLREHLKHGLPQALFSVCCPLLPLYRSSMHDKLYIMLIKQGRADTLKKSICRRDMPGLAQIESAVPDCS